MPAEAVVVVKALLYKHQTLNKLQIPFQMRRVFFLILFSRAIFLNSSRLWVEQNAVFLFAF